MRERKQIIRTGELVRLCREEAGLTQSKLAFSAHITQSELSKIERGKVVPKVDLLELLLNACGYELGVREKL